MIHKFSKGTRLVSKKTGKDLGEFTVHKTSGGYEVKDKSGKNYKTFTSREKALHYTEYLAHKQEATVQYYKKLGRHNAFFDDLSLKETMKLMDNDEDSQFLRPINKIQENFIADWDMKYEFLKHLAIIFDGNEDNIKSAYRAFFEADYKIEIVD